MKKESGFTWKLGMFVMIGLSAFVITIYLVGKQKNLFGSTFHLKSLFKNVSGLKEGNNIRFSGINIGTVDNIELITDTSVIVGMTIKKEVQQFIKTDAIASIASDGLMGDKVLTISPGKINGSTVKNNDLIVSKSAIEIADVMSSLKASVDNAGIITEQIAQFSYKMNNGKGALTKLVSDETFSNSLKGTLTNLQTSTNAFAQFTTNLNDGKLSNKLDSTMSNIQAGTKGLSDNMEAVKHSFLLRGYFKKQKKAEIKNKENINTKNDLLNTNGEKKKNLTIDPIIFSKDSIK